MKVLEMEGRGQLGGGGGGGNPLFAPNPCAVCGGRAR